MMLVALGLFYLSASASAQSIGCSACREPVLTPREIAISRCFRDAPWDNKHDAIRTCLSYVDVTNPKEKK